VDGCRAGASEMSGGMVSLIYGCMSCFGVGSERSERRQLLILIVYDKEFNRVVLIGLMVDGNEFREVEVVESAMSPWLEMFKIKSERKKND
jgi:hypothetical protein